MDKNVSRLLNSQINKEFYSSYLYFEFANYYQEAGLDGFYNWYYVQAQEEMDHALLMVKYLQNNGEKVTFDAIAKPSAALTDNMAPLKAAFEHEKYITGEINEIYAAANAATGSEPPAVLIALAATAAAYAGVSIFGRKNANKYAPVIEKVIDM